MTAPSRYGPFLYVGLALALTGSLWAFINEDALVAYLLVTVGLAMGAGYSLARPSEFEAGWLFALVMAFFAAAGIDSVLAEEGYVRRTVFGLFYLSGCAFAFSVGRVAFLRWKTRRGDSAPAGK